MVLQICTFRVLGFVSFEVAGIWGLGFRDFTAFGLWGLRALGLYGFRVLWL